MNRIDNKKRTFLSFETFEKIKCGLSRCFIVILFFVLIVNVVYSDDIKSDNVGKKESYLEINTKTSELTYYFDGKIVRGTIVILDKYIKSNTSVFFFEPKVLYAGYDGKLVKENEVKNKMDKKAMTEIEEKLTKNKNKNDLQIGDSFFFGRYEQDDLKFNGRERIEWLVAKIDSDKLYLISKKVLDFLNFDDDWINEEFMKSFTDDEINQMIKVDGKLVFLYDDELSEVEKIASYPSAYTFHKGIDVEREENDNYMNCSFKINSGKLIDFDGKIIEPDDINEYGFRPMVCIKR